MQPGFIENSTKAEAESAIREMDGKLLLDQRIEVSWALSIRMWLYLESNSGRRNLRKTALLRRKKELAKDGPERLSLHIVCRWSGTKMTSWTMTRACARADTLNVYVHVGPDGLHGYTVHTRCCETQKHHACLAGAKRKPRNHYSRIRLG